LDTNDDNKFLAAAVVGRADYIVSGDKHLLSLEEFEGIPILNSRQFLQVIQLSSFLT
jgi:predicted nucleic acid-binding protein